MTNVWDDPRLKANDDFVKWENPGDKLVGEILHLSVHTFDDGKVAPKLIVRQDDDVERTLTAGQVQLMTKLAELRPNVGDRIAIVFTEIEKRQAGRTLKHFEVELKRGTGAGSSAAEPASEPAPEPAKASSLL